MSLRLDFMAKSQMFAREAMIHDGLTNPLYGKHPALFDVDLMLTDPPYRKQYSGRSTARAT